MEPSTTTWQHGTIVMGGSPLRLLKLSARAQALTAAWQAGATVGERPAEQRLARRLVSSGAYVPHPGAGAFDSSDVTVVIPVRDRPQQLAGLLKALQGLTCVVVNDASADTAATKEIAADANATCISLSVNMGPAAARNAGLRVVTTPLVAFLDSDCQPPVGWLSSLLGYFDDPLVAAVAPRIVAAADASPTWWSRYAATHSSLDQGTTDGLVRPLSRIPYVPSAALVVRHAATAQPFFDPELRGGEDVDLVWRLHRAGWDVRYVTACPVAHQGPPTMGSWLSRRYFYGTTAGPLARRHPAELPPLSTSAWTAAVWGLAVVRRPFWAGAALGVSVLVLARRLKGLVDEPLTLAAQIAGGGTVKSALPALGGVTRAWSPALALALCFRRTRRAAALALVAPAVAQWAKDPGGLDPVRASVCHVADDVAYGAGVWAGCLQARTARPLIPRISFRTRVWSQSALARQLRGQPVSEGGR
jgi:mycofactocin glycosyltransferase